MKTLRDFLVPIGDETNNYVTDDLRDFAVGIAISNTEVGKLQRYQPLSLQLTTEVDLEIHGAGGDWIHINQSGEGSSVVATLDAGRTRVVINHPDNSNLPLSTSIKTALTEFTKQVHLECLRAGTVAIIATKHKNHPVEEFMWGDDLADEPSTRVLDETGGDAKSKTKHFLVPVLSPEELHAAKELSEFNIVYTPYAEGLKNVLKAHENEPAYLQGAAGTGKSLLAQILGRETNKSVINRVTFTAKMDVAMTLGNRFPTNMWQASDGTVVATTGIGEDMSEYKHLGIGLDWRDGVVTRMARETGSGGMLVLDELPKAPPEFVNRLHEILEDEFPTMTIYENAEDQAPVNKDLWVIATGNPVGGGYFNNPLDKALLDRMRVFNINKPIADESKILEGLLPEKFFGETAIKLERAAKTLRDNEETAISTRALIMIAKSILRGVNPVAAFQINYFNTLTKDGSEQAEAAVQTHFFADWAKFGPVAILGY
mgnify:CR=1 FL=1|tara:strand:+ start:680 stop:2137 length:1458 start_codon:yes stop_codon:yes gene_type:complete